MGHSGGGAHALACGALLSDRLIGPVSVSGLAPYDAEGLDWFAGMGPAGAAELRAAASGRMALMGYLTSSEFDPELFTAADHAALKGAWHWLGVISGRALEGGLGGMVDDDLAYVASWGCDPGRSARRCCSCRGARIESRPARTANGSRVVFARQNSGCARTTDTSPSSAPLRRPWTGSWSMPTRWPPGRSERLPVP